MTEDEKVIVTDWLRKTIEQLETRAQMIEADEFAYTNGSYRDAREKIKEANTLRSMLGRIQ
tara:strand:- start:247 stop:429 length:183 start_codon:yes stop_codon:yes gene_type:complete